MSAKTVDHHVSAVLAKLGAATRRRGRARVPAGAEGQPAGGQSGEGRERQTRENSRCRCRRAGGQCRPQAGDASAPNGDDKPCPVTSIERTFPDGLGLAPTQQGSQAAAAVVGNNAKHGVTWVHSYVTPDKKRTFCIYDGPTPEAIRKVAGQTKLPVDKITEVRVLDPYFAM